MEGYVYILTNKHNNVLYTGVTNNLKKRLSEHSDGSSWFTTKYKTNKLVYVEAFATMGDAILREKQIKRMTREHKLKTITNANENWENLAETLQ